MIVRRLVSVGSSVLAAALLATAAASLTGCVPLVVAGVGAGVMVATDRRSSGAQVDDETIELKIAKAMTDRWGSKDVHLNATSYNGVVLLTGEVPSTVIQDEIVQFVKSTDRVRIVENDTTIGPVADFQSRTNDTYITSKVKARMVEAAKFAPNHVKVVTERGVVYLMGIVSRQEGDDAAQIAATTSGVARVVKVFEYTN